MSFSNSQLPKDTEGEPLRPGVYVIRRGKGATAKAVKMRLFDDETGDLYVQPYDGSGRPQRVDEMDMSATWGRVAD